MHSLPIIKRWLDWEIGSRNRVVLAHDPFIGYNKHYKLTAPLLQILNTSLRLAKHWIESNLAYQSILYFNNMEKKKWWYKSIWVLNIPIKLVCFIWINFNYCILIGVNYQNWGGIGPSVCNLFFKKWRIHSTSICRFP